jgi:hypothetical protein
MENLFTQNLVGKALAGQYKRAGREAVAMSLEVSAHVVLPDSRGKNVPYLFGTRTDPANAGAVVLVRTGCFNPATAQIEDVANFKPIKGPAEGEWFVTPPGDASGAFAFVERLTDKALQEWASTLGSLPLAQFLAKDSVVPETKKARRSRKA